MLALVEKYGIKILKDEARTNVLAELYVKNGIIPAAYHLDSLHVAMASVNNLDCIVSYNFKHINRVKTKILTTRVNQEAGYSGIVICTSKEVLDDEV
jgi:hypothetical protein